VRPGFDIGLEVLRGVVPAALHVFEAPLGGDRLGNPVDVDTEPRPNQ
jgi:hypothetical protein